MEITERRGSPVSCPVCTLYMREGVTLQHHLNTHPKEQVIAALVRISAAEHRYKLATASDRSSSVPGTTCSQELPVLGRSIPSVSTQFSQAGSSHFTTAITYQHFLSSNGVPHYVSMPAILSEPGTSPASANQAAFMHMVYSPYLMQQQQQQQVQMLNSVSPSPQQQSYIRHALSPSASLFSPSSIQSQSMEILPASLTINIPFSADNLPTELRSSSSSSEQQAFHNTPISNSSTSSQKLSLSTSSATSVASFVVVSGKDDDRSSAEVPDGNAPVTPPERNQSTNAECSLSPTSAPRVRDEEQQTEGSSFSSDSSTESCDIGEETASSTCFTAPCCSGKDETTQTANSYDYTGVDQKLAASSVLEKHRSECESENDNDSENNESDKETDNHNEQHIAATEEEEGTSPNLSPETPLRSETNDFTSNTVSDPLIQAGDINNKSGEQPNNEESLNTSIASDMIQISGLVRNALEIQPPAMCNDGEYMACSYQGEADNPNEPPDSLSEEKRGNALGGEKPESSLFMNAEASDSYTIINIDGLQVAVPDGLVKASASLILTSNESTNVAETVQNMESCEASLSNEPTLNIHTDETMPPRGELSEQESVGGNDTSLWTQALNENEASTPCDLLARESWEASDGSDADAPPENDCLLPQLNQERECALPLKLQLKQSFKEPRLYTCALCNENFNCPKERRVHQATFHGEVGESSKEENSDETTNKLPNKRKCNLKDMAKDGGDYGNDNDVDDAADDDDDNDNNDNDNNDNDQYIQTENSSCTEMLTDEKTTKPKEDSKEPKEAVIGISKTKTSKQKHSVHGYLCSRCPEMFSTLKLRTAHEYRVHQITKEVKNVCKTCNEAFENESSFKDHLQIHPLECSHCGKCFKRRQNLDLHIRRHLDIKPYKCTVCDKAFVTKQKLAEHTNTHTGNAPIKCPMCDETFRRYSNLIQHKNRHHLKKKKKIKDFICRCGEIFHTKKKLEWHKETHDLNPKRCKYCSERFVHVSSLTRHIRKAHDCRYIPEGGRKSENVECSVCGFVFLKGSIQVHMRMHKGERPFSCHVCGKDFTTKWNLQLHRWTHATRSSKPFKCKLCKSAFFRFTDLAAHENSHRNVRPFTCNYCGSRFIRKYNCLRHVREHEKGKTFSCSICNKTFHRSYYLKEHLRVHSGVRPFACHICGKASTTKSNHNKHVKIHHAREQVNTEG